MPEVRFVNEKAVQLVSLYNQFLLKAEGHNALIELTWDILFDWQQLNLANSNEVTTKERVFWHMLFELQYWEKHVLIANDKLKNDLSDCALYLQNEQRIPLHCIGLRPELSPIEAEIETPLAAEVA